MINKQNLWFGTLFSLILVLGIYYVTIGDEALNVNDINSYSEPVINVEETNSLMAMQVAEDEAMLEEIESYESILLSVDASLEEKNDAYESLDEINNKKGQIEELSNLIQENFNLESFIKITNDQINITIAGNEHDSTLANNIIRLIQEKYDTQMYISVKFQG